MKIDEVIKVMEFFLHKQCDLGRMKFTPYDDDNLIWHVVNDVFEEWKWYKSQDLVQRGKVNIATGKLFAYCKEKAEEMGCEIKLDAEIMKMIEIPKAEPTKEER